MVEYKTENERREEIKNLLSKLADLNITLKIDGMKEFLDKSNDYIKNGTYFKGKIKLKGVDREMHCFFPLVKGVVADITLKYIKDT